MKNKIKQLNSGFSLMEMLVTIIVVAVIGTIATTTLFSLLRGASKTESIKEIKQNGDYAMSVMENNIRNGSISDADCTGVASDSLTITNNDGTTTRYGYLQDLTHNVYRITTWSSASGNTRYLTNTAVTFEPLYIGVISFTCTNASGNKSVVINFTLIQSDTLWSVDKTASATFQTQVSLRNR